MELYCQRDKTCIWWLTTDYGTDRKTIHALWDRVTTCQRVAGIPRRYSLLLFETGEKPGSLDGHDLGNLHGNIVFIGDLDGRIAEKLKRSKYGSIIKVQAVTDLENLLLRYLPKECTPQAKHAFGDAICKRRPGSHRRSGGGDNVRLSVDLFRAMQVAGKIKDGPRTYARRKPPSQRKRTEHYSPRPGQKLRKTAPRPAGQIPLLPELDRPVSRLRDFGGGFIPSNVAREIEHKRHRLGLSQSQLARLIGRSQGQLANALRGHDPISRTAVNRLREALGSRKKI